MNYVQMYQMIYQSELIDLSFLNNNRYLAIELQTGHLDHDSLWIILPVMSYRAYFDTVTAQIKDGVKRAYDTGTMRFRVFFIGNTIDGSTIFLYRGFTYTSMTYW